MRGSLRGGGSPVALARPLPQCRQPRTAS